MIPLILIVSVWRVGNPTAALLAQLTQAQQAQQAPAQAPNNSIAGLSLSALLGTSAPNPSPAASLALPVGTGCCAPTAGPQDASTPKVALKCHPEEALFRLVRTGVSLKLALKIACLLSREK